MNLIPNFLQFGKSLLTGSEGQYDVLGVDVIFQKEGPLLACRPIGVYGNKRENFFLRSFKNLAQRCFTSPLFQKATLGTLHIFVHEMGHALTSKAFIKGRPTVLISKNQGGITKYRAPPHPISGIANSMIGSAGACANIAFSSVLLMGARALRNTWAWPISAWLGAGSFLWMTGELLYAHTSAMNQDSGDFGSIAKRNLSHLRIATVSLAAVYSMGLVGAAFASI